MEISLLIWSNQISLFLWISSYPNVTIRVGDNYFWKLITIRGPYGTQKGALGAPGKKKGFQKGGSKESGSSDESRYTSVKIPKKKFVFLKIFQSPKFFFKSMTFFTFHGDLIADLIKSNFPFSLDFFIPKWHNKNRGQQNFEIYHILRPLRGSKGGP